MGSLLFKLWNWCQDILHLTWYFILSHVWKERTIQTKGWNWFNWITKNFGKATVRCYAGWCCKSTCTFLRDCTLFRCSMSVNINYCIIEIMTGLYKQKKQVSSKLFVIFLSASQNNLTFLTNQRECCIPIMSCFYLNEARRRVVSMMFYVDIGPINAGHMLLLTSYFMKPWRMKDLIGNIGGGGGGGGGSINYSGGTS